MKHISLIAALALPLLLADCAAIKSATDKKADAAEETFLLGATDFAQLQGWSGDAQSAALVAFKKSCAAMAKKDATETLRGYAGTAGDWQAVCKQAPEEADDAAARSFFETHFTPYAVYGAKKQQGLFTGYYEPELRGSSERKEPYLTPLYGRPADMLTVSLGDFSPDLTGKTITGRVDGDKFVPYYKRADIEGGAIAEQKKEIVWVDSAVDVFFLHIQGSGVVTMEDGSKLHVGYAAQNGRPYLAVGKALIERGALTKENVSMQSIRKWLEENPAEAPAVMNLNESYVFFREIDGDGPLGAQGVALTPERSMAVDRKKIPYGAPLWLDAAAPEGGQDVPPRLQRLLIAQDTGGAIKGSVRGDYFWGAGERAAHNAGLMKSAGQYYILLPKTVAVPDNYIYRWWRAFGGNAVNEEGLNH